MIKRMLIMLVAVGSLIGAFVYFEHFKAQMIKGVFAKGPPPQTVSTMTAGVQEWQPQLEAVGSLRAVNGTDLSLEIAGIVQEIHFKSGDDVEAGTLLLSLNADPDIAQLH